MIIYEVNLSISGEIKEDFLKWLPSHVEELLALPGFDSAYSFTQLEPSSTNFNMVIQYHLEDLKSLNSYFDQNAERLKQQTFDRFGNSFTANRRILKKS